MKVAVIGAGALGTLLGGLLADAGQDVHLLHHDPAVAAEIEREGVHVEGNTLPQEPLSLDLPVTTDATVGGPADLGLVTVRSYQTRDALEEHAACIGPETRLLTFQNGLSTYETLREIVGDRALGGYALQGASIESPGRVRHTNSGPVRFGGPDRAFARKVADAFAACGFDDVTVVDDPIPHIWDKQLTSSLSFKPIAALTRLVNGPMVADDALVAVMEALTAEAQAVAEARGIPLLTEDPVARVVELGRNNPDHPSSMFQDVRAGRKTEIDELNGAVVDYAREAGVNAPVNELLTALVRGLERSYLDE